MRPIDADFLDEILDAAGDGRSRTANMIFAAVKETVSCIRTLTLDDLRPEGRWEKDERGKCRCSACKKNALEPKPGVYFVPGFCYHCGADMRGGGEDKDLG